MAFPVVAMQVSDQRRADPADFLFLAILLTGVGIAYELAARISNERAYRAAGGIALAAALLQIWINLSMGIIGNEDDPANLIYLGVLIVAAVGTLVARLRPRRMCRAMVATAIAQTLAFVIALIAGLGFTGPITLFFVALWLASARLFGKAADARAHASSR